MGPYVAGGNWIGATAPKDLNELLHPLPCLLGLLLELLLNAVDLRPHRALDLARLAADVRLRLALVLLQAALRLTPLAAHEPEHPVAALAQLADHAVAGDASA